MRHYEDLLGGAARGLVFSPAHAHHVIDYIERFFVHVKGPLARQPILLDPWQRFWTAVLYGWRRAGDGLRRFTRAYEEVARKNGKSTWKSPQGAYLFTMDGEPGAEVYAVATTRDQALTVFKPAFDNFRRWACQSKKVERSFQIFSGVNQEKIVCDSAVFKPLPANVDALDGLNPSAVLYDELHRQKTRDVWDLMESGFGARPQPLLSAITTAGYILDGVCVEVRGYVVSILEGRRQDDSFFGYVYTLDEGDDPLDEHVWLKANPSLGSAKTLDYMRDQARKAAALPSAAVNFATKDLNLWRGSPDGWIDMAVWDKGGAPFDSDMLRGRRCYGGLDLASTRDLTAFALYFPADDPDEDDYLLVWTWCPEAKVSARAEKDDAAPYGRWVQQGWLTATPGDVTDYGPVKDKIRWAVQTFALVELGFDSWNAQQLANDLLGENVPMVEVPQNTGGMYPGSKKLEELTYARRLRHGGNPVLRYCVGNTALLFDSNGNFRPDKKRSNIKGRIDACVASVIAIGCAVRPQEEPAGADDLADYLPTKQ